MTAKAVPLTGAGKSQTVLPAVSVGVERDFNRFTDKNTKNYIKSKKPLAIRDFSRYNKNDESNGHFPVEIMEDEHEHF